MITRIVFCIFVFSLIHQRLIAQFNDTTHHKINASFSGNFNHISDGVTYLLNNSLQYGFKDKDLVLNAGAKWLYGANPQKQTNNDFNASLDGNLYKTFPHFYYWGLLHFTSSYSLRINQQTQAGAGVAYRLIDKKDMMLSISDGFLYEYSNIINEESNNFVYETVRNSLRLQYRYSYRDRIHYRFTGFYQPSLQYRNDYIVSVVSSVNVKLWKWLAANASFTYNKITRTNRENLLITYGIVAERFF